VGGRHRKTTKLQETVNRLTNSEGSAGQSLGRLALVGGGCALTLVAGAGSSFAATGSQTPENALNPSSTPSTSNDASTLHSTNSNAASQAANAGKTVSGKATLFGGQGDYQPLACGGQSSNVTQGVALWTVPCGSQVRITNPQTGKSVVAPVADRGPAAWTGAAIDLLPGTWDALGVSRSAGRQHVTYQVLGQ